MVKMLMVMMMMVIMIINEVNHLFLFYGYGGARDKNMSAFWKMKDEGVDNVAFIVDYVVEVVVAVDDDYEGDDDDNDDGDDYGGGDNNDLEFANNWQIEHWW